MLDALARIFDDGGRLVGVSGASFEGDPSFLCAIAFEFEHLTAVFRAVPDDDTLAVTIGPLAAQSEETIVDLREAKPWSQCVGLEISWAWRLTNQQGYTDGVRLEFSAPNQSTRPILELIVMASMLKVFESRPLPSG